MISESERLAILVFVGQLGLPLEQVLAPGQTPRYERMIERLIAANGDALDVFTADTSDLERCMLLKAGVLVRHWLAQPNPRKLIR